MPPRFSWGEEAVLGVTLTFLSNSLAPENLRGYIQDELQALDGLVA